MRREFSVKVKKAAYERSKGICEICGLKILGHAEFDHKIPLGLSGKSDMDNIACLCKKCHRIKTHEQDRPIMQKADRQRKSAAGIKKKYVWPKRRFGQ